MSHFNITHFQKRAVSRKKRPLRENFLATAQWSLATAQWSLAAAQWSLAAAQWSLAAAQ